MADTLVRPASPDVTSATERFCAILFFRRVCLFISAVASSSIFPLSCVENVINVLSFLLAGQPESLENPGLQALAAVAMKEVLKALQGSEKRCEVAAYPELPDRLSLPFRVLTSTPPGDHVLAASLLGLCETVVRLLPVLGSLLPIECEIPPDEAVVGSKAREDAQVSFGASEATFPSGSPEALATLATLATPAPLASLASPAEPPEAAQSIVHSTDRRLSPFHIGAAARSLIGFAACLGPSGSQEFQAVLNALAALVRYLRYLLAHGHLFARQNPATLEGGTGVSITPGELRPEISAFGIFITDGVFFICQNILPRGGASGARCLQLATECARYLEEAEFAAQTNPNAFSLSLTEVICELGRNVQTPGRPGENLSRDFGTEQQGRRDEDEGCDISVLTDFLSRLGARALAALDTTLSLTHSLCSQDTIEESAALAYCLLQILLNNDGVRTQDGLISRPESLSQSPSASPRMLPGETASSVIKSVLQSSDSFHRSLSEASLPELPPLETLARISGTPLQLLGSFAMFYTTYLSEYRGQTFSSLLALFRPAMLLFSRAALDQGLEPVQVAVAPVSEDSRPFALPLSPHALSEPLGATSGCGPAEQRKVRIRAEVSRDANLPVYPLLSWARECALALQPVCKGEYNVMVGRALAWLSWAQHEP